MAYSVEYSDDALRDLKKIDKHQSKIIISWIEKNLIGCIDPRQHGKTLRYGRRNEWCYRIGSYRLIADIQDDVVTIEIVNVGHRREVY
jgi:mRNA interferase RelE/StbE